MAHKTILQQSLDFLKEQSLQRCSMESAAEVVVEGQEAISNQHYS